MAHATPVVSGCPLEHWEAGEEGVKEEKCPKKRKEFSAGIAYEAEKPVAFIKNSVFLWSTGIVSQRCPSCPWTKRLWEQRNRLRLERERELERGKEKKQREGKRE